MTVARDVKPRRTKQSISNSANSRRTPLIARKNAQPTTVYITVCKQPGVKLETPGLNSAEDQFPPRNFNKQSDYDRKPPTNESKKWTAAESRTVLIEQYPGQDRPLSQNDKDGEDRISSTRNKEEGKDQIPLVLSKKNVKNQDGPDMEPYSSVCTFDETSDVALFTHRNYKVAVTMGLSSTKI